MFTFLPQKHLIRPGTIRMFCTVGAMNECATSIQDECGCTSYVKDPIMSPLTARLASKR